MPDRRPTKAEERARARLNEVMQELEGVQLDMRLAFQRLSFEHVPIAWTRVDELPVRPHKVRITAAYDIDVAKFFRNMGHGYQARMNLVLRTYMLAILSREIRSKQNQDYMGNDI